MSEHTSTFENNRERLYQLEEEKHNEVNETYKRPGTPRNNSIPALKIVTPENDNLKESSILRAKWKLLDTLLDKIDNLYIQLKMQTLLKSEFDLERFRLQEEVDKLRARVDRLSTLTKKSDENVADSSVIAIEISRIQDAIEISRRRDEINKVLVKVDKLSTNHTNFVEQNRSLSTKIKIQESEIAKLKSEVDSLKSLNKSIRRWLLFISIILLPMVIPILQRWIGIQGR
jgi:hypothetical protein